MNKKTFYEWRYKYKKYGIDGLKESKSWKKYSKELKEQVVKDNLSDECSLRDVARKYEISSKLVVEKWVNMYNNHRELKATPKGMSNSMTKGRATSWKERIEIVQYCLAHNKDYQVSYQQVYQWVSAILDLHDKSIVAYVLGHSNNNQLVLKTLDLALEAGTGPMIHSDRGFQYTSYGFKRRLEAAGMTHSMSRVGKCIDNGPMESFWGIIKCENYYLNKYRTYEELSEAIDEYIQFYNNERLQEKLNGLSPMEFRVLAA